MKSIGWPPFGAFFLCPVAEKLHAIFDLVEKR